MLTPEISKIISDAYGLDDIVSIEKVEEGVINHNYILASTKGKYFLKTNSIKIKEAVPYTYTAENFMSMKGVPAVTMLKTTDGQIYLEFEGMIYTLYPYIESDRGHNYLLEDYFRMGEMLAKIHVVGNKDIPQIFVERRGDKRLKETSVEILQIWKDRIMAIEGRTEIDDMFLKDIEFKLRTVADFEDMQPAERDTLLHGDFQTGNILLDKNTREIIGVCDWEKAMYSFRAYEIARSIMYICFEDKSLNSENSYVTTKSFLQGYQSIYPISRKELIYGLRYRTYTTLLSSWIQNYYYNQGSDRANKFLSFEMTRMKIFTDSKNLEKIAAFLE